MTVKSMLRHAAQPVLGRIAFSLRTRCRETPVRIPVIGGTGLGFFDQVRTNAETWKLDLYRFLLESRKGIFLDIGVNLGQTLVQIRTINPNRPYVGFEPNPRCIGYVERLAELNRYRNVELLAAAIGKQCGTMSLHLPEGRSTDSTATLIKDLRPSTRHMSRPAPVLSEHELEGLMAERSAGVIKVDVEGAELEVLLGLRGLLARDRPAVVCEVLFADPNADLDWHQQRNQRLTRLLQVLDYEVYQVQKSACGRSLLGLDRIDEFQRGFYSPSTADQCDYLFMPSEMAASCTGGVCSSVTNQTAETRSISISQPCSSP